MSNSLLFFFLNIGGGEGSNGTRALLFRDTNPPGMKQPFNPLQLKTFQLGYDASQIPSGVPGGGMMILDTTITQPQAEQAQAHPAPKPPPRAKTSTTPTGATPSGHQQQQTFIIPTKSGAEPRKVMYPKETHVVRGKVVRARVGGPSTGPFEFYPQNFFVAGAFWGTKTPAAPPPMFHGRFSALEMPELGRSREAGSSLPLEYRRRSRSKSPARRSVPLATPVPNWPQRFLRDFSDAMRVKRGKDKGDDFAERMKSFTQHQAVISTQVVTSGFPAKPAIRKSCRSAKSRASTRRVTFNSYATVRLLDFS